MLEPVIEHEKLNCSLTFDLHSGPEAVRTDPEDRLRGGCDELPREHRWLVAHHHRVCRPGRRMQAHAIPALTSIPPRQNGRSESSFRETLYDPSHRRCLASTAGRQVSDRNNWER